VLFIIGFVLLFVLLWAVFYAIGPLLERLLAHVAHRAAAFRYRDYLPVAVVLAVGIAATVAAGDAFVDIAERVHAGSAALTDIDGEVHAWARTTYTSGATTFFTAMTLIGNPVGLGLIMLAVSIVVAMERRWKWLAYLLLTTVTGGLLNLQLKAWFARARPELAEALRDAHGYSFPSGHAMGSTVVFGAVAYIAFRVLHHWRARAAALSFAFSMIVAISVSRIYLGVHWISDVAAGVAAGAIWVTTTTVAYETFRRIRLVRSLRAKRSVTTATGSDA
jgi:membrane-associated phospholipid phosphatase